MEAFESAISHALQRVCPGITPKPEQLDAIRAVYNGKDVFVWLPTGFGKSFCYEMLPFVMDHKLGRVSTTCSSVVLVISPLIALMVDQVISLRRRGIRAAVLSTGSGVEKSLIASEEDLAECSLLYSAPESLVISRWRDVLETPVISKRIVAVIVDEAHCVSMWSKDFRPAYGRLHEIRALMPPCTPLLACTATATKSVREQLIVSLNMEGCELVFTSVDRPNIYHEVKGRTDIKSDMEPFVNSLKKNKISSPRVIVYCQSLNFCSDLYAHFLFELGDRAYYPMGSEKIPENRVIAMFHSRTNEENKKIVLASLTKPKGTVRIVFATVALGMGIHLADADTILHYGAPTSIDDYCQSSGRGGRSGGQAKSIIFWKPRDCPRKKDPTTPHDHEMAAVRSYLELKTTCRRKWLLGYFGQSSMFTGGASLCCDICSDACQTLDTQ